MLYMRRSALLLHIGIRYGAGGFNDMYRVPKHADKTSEFKRRLGVRRPVHHRRTAATQIVRDQHHREGVADSDTRFQLYVRTYV
jgi:hypothetical protein